MPIKKYLADDFQDNIVITTNTFSSTEEVYKWINDYLNEKV